MNFKLLTSFFISFLTLISATAFADNNANLIYYQENHDPSATLRYWTPERLRDAKILMPLVDPSKLKKISIEELLAEQQGAKPVSVSGSPPKIDVKPAMNYLYKPLPNTTQTPTKSFDQGALNEPYSSSQLIPAAANTVYPYRTVGKLFFTIPGQGNFACSAATISNRIVLTAGHCVHSGTNGNSGFYTNFLFVPAFSNGNAPFNSWTSSFVTAATPWINSGGVLPNASDFGMLEMVDQVINGKTTRVSDAIGFLGFLTLSLMPNHVHMLGYACNLDNCQQMHQVISQSAVAISPSNVQYGSDMLGGSDGGPWVQNLGVPSSGQTGSGTSASFPNRLVGITSIGLLDSTQKGLMSPIPDNTNFLGLFNSICAHQANNCN